MPDGANFIQINDLKLITRFLITTIDCPITIRFNHIQRSIIEEFI